MFKSIIFTTKTENLLIFTYLNHCKKKNKEIINILWYKRWIFNWGNFALKIFLFYWQILQNDKYIFFNNHKNCSSKFWEKVEIISIFFQLSNRNVFETAWYCVLVKTIQNSLVFFSYSGSKVLKPIKMINERKEPNMILIDIKAR